MNLEELQKLINLDYLEWANSDTADIEWLFNKMQDLADRIIKLEEDNGRLRSRADYLEIFKPWDA